jgi:hypothetical protein
MSCRITKAILTHSEYVILTAFPQQQWINERASSLRFYTHRLSWSDFITERHLTRCPRLTSATVRVRTSHMYVHSNCRDLGVAHGACCTGCIHIASYLVGRAAFYTLVHFFETFTAVELQVAAPFECAMLARRCLVFPFLWDEVTFSFNISLATCLSSRHLIYVLFYIMTMEREAIK